MRFMKESLIHELMDAKPLELSPSRFELVKVRYTPDSGYRDRWKR